VIARIFGIVALVLLLGVGYRIYTFLDGTFFGSEPAPGKEVAVRIPAGAGVGKIGDILDAAGVVSNGQAWALKVHINGDGGQLHPGLYHLREHEHYSVIIRTLSRTGTAGGRVVKLAVPEGLRIRDIARLVRKVGISPAAYRHAIAVTPPPKGFRPTGNERLTMEGFLFPATYQLRTPVKAATLAHDQLAAFSRNVRHVDFSAARRKKLTPYDVLIIASLIEREVAYPPERAKVAAVIYNRLHRGMPLQIDATIQYAVGSWRPLRGSDLDIKSPFNLRSRSGLPPTPIANPGLAAIRAAAHPAKVDYLYYVAIPGDKQRRSYFTDNLADFNRFQQEHPAH
jgi:UPF0755 protein